MNSLVYCSRKEKEETGQCDFDSVKNRILFIFDSVCLWKCEWNFVVF